MGKCQLLLSASPAWFDRMRRKASAADPSMDVALAPPGDEEGSSEEQKCARAALGSAAAISCKATRMFVLGPGASLDNLWVPGLSALRRVSHRGRSKLASFKERWFSVWW